MKPIEYLGMSFFDLMKIQPRDTFYSTSLSLAFSMVKLDMKDKQTKGENTVNNEKHLKTLKYIEQNTHRDLLMPFAVAEAIVASTERERWNREYEGRNNEDGRMLRENGQTLRVLDIFRLLKEAYTPIMDVVVDIIQPYSIEYRTSMDSGGYAPGWLGGKEQQHG